MRQVKYLVVLCAIIFVGCREYSHKNKADKISGSPSINQKIADLTVKQQLAKSHYHFVESARIQLEINYFTEVNELNDDAMRDELERKYELLRSIFIEEQANLKHPLFVFVPLQSALFLLF